MVSNNIKSFISDLPKVELHLHLEGAIPLNTLLQLIEKYEGKNYITLTELQQKFIYTNFTNFLEIWYWKNNYIREYEDYEFIAEHVAYDLAEQNIRYAEIYFSPSDFTKIDSQPQEIATAIRNGLDKFSDKITIRLISDLVRDNKPKISLLNNIYEVKDQGIIGIGLGGDEENYPPKLFTQVYELANKMGFHLTCHAGEAAGPDYIWQAIKELSAERIGHGTSAIKDENLIEHLIAEQIPVEMCPNSNVKTSAVSSLKEHPIYEFYKRGMLVSVNTDDPKMFNTTMVNEYVSLIETFDLELSDIYSLSQNSIKSAWCSDDIKTVLSEELSFYFSSHTTDINSGKGN